MRAVIIANGRQGPSLVLRQLVRRAGLLACADGGVRLARRLGRAPHVVIGDLDSASRADLRWAQERGAAIIRYPRDKDKTDTELALDHAIAAGAHDIDLVAALGGRVDHALANVVLLIHAQDRRRRARIRDGRTELFLAEVASSIAGAVGDLVSLIPLTGSVRGVTTRGLKYPLAGATLRAGTTRGISNEVTSVPASVGARRGRLLVIVTHRSG